MDVDGESLPAVTSSGLDILSLANWALGEGGRLSSYTSCRMGC